MWKRLIVSHRLGEDTMEGKPSRWPDPTWDPYCEWLAIPPSHDSSDPRRLLGLRPNEWNLERIQRAGEQQLRRLEPYLTGERADVASELLRQVTAAVDRLSAESLARGTAESDAPTEPKVSESEEVFPAEEPSVEDPSSWTMEASKVAYPRSRPALLPLRVVLSVSLVTVGVLSFIAVVLVWQASRGTVAPPVEARAPAVVATPAAAKETSPARFVDSDWRPVTPPRTQREPTHKVEPILAANTAGEESYPAVTADGRSLFFLRRVGQNNEVHELRRKDEKESFDEERLWPATHLRSVVLGGVAPTPGGGLAFARSRGRAKEIVELTASEKEVAPNQTEPANVTYGLKVVAPRFSGDVQGVSLSADGLGLLISRTVDGALRIYEAKRPEASLPFTSLTLAPISQGYRHPAMSNDRTLMVMEGLAQDGRVALYRSERPSEVSAWGEPVCWEEIRSAKGHRGDFTPSLSADGTILFFASDRASEDGLLDLFWIKVDRGTR